MFFPPYDAAELAEIVVPRLREAFAEDTLPKPVINRGLNLAASRWGDARKTLTLFRQAGETATERGLAAVTVECLEDNLDTTDKAALREKLLSLPAQHFLVLAAITARTNRLSGEVVQPVTSGEMRTAYERMVNEEARVSERALRDVVTDLETMSLIDTWITSEGEDGRVKHLETTFRPAWVQEMKREYFEAKPGLQIVE